jgi:predicted RNA-binding protein associated with RNAse of E/G family
LSEEYLEDIVPAGFFDPGQHVVLREIWDRQIWSARPAIVVQDTPELIACYIAPGSPWKMPRSSNGERVSPARRRQEGLVLQDAAWLDIGLLRLSIPGDNYSVLIFRNSSGAQTHWYINLEEPLERTRLGFDYRDQILDVILTPDLTSWRWEDEDELAEAISARLVTEELAAALHARGKAVVGELRSGRSVFNEWERWRPDPSWSILELRDGWDVIDSGPALS